MSYSIQTDKLDALYQKLKPSGVTMSALLCKVGIIGNYWTVTCRSVQSICPDIMEQ